MLLTAVLAMLLGHVSGTGQGPGLATAQADLGAGRFEQARDGFEAVLAVEPANTAAQDGEVSSSERLALAARSRHDEQLALETLLRAQKFAPDNVRLLLDLGVLEDQMQLYWDADRALAQAAELKPAESTVIYAIARVKLDLLQLTAAEQEMRAYLRLRPEDATAHYGLGHILQVAQRPEEAQAEFKKSLQLQPRQTEAYYQLGELALEAGKYAEALPLFATTLAGNPQHGGALAGAGIAHFRLRQYTEAQTLLQEAVVQAPEYQPGHYYLGLTLSRQGHKLEAEKELAVAAKMAEEQNKAASQRLRLLVP